ncbi:anaerobic dimethyl sulfoxide reductase subunit A [Sanguibacter gelidistatuariae]|uniref:Anaerobic dimethyl sulfoxide reductase subunit A n=1 Tax=Sanguibacter gelidistatuariae TaxID=1814289 RepID=A0A1G6GR02_9MICO|nr:DMSO/selenate family reductase complex A subunit [Sanguibacter gelidistatuariae]SDB84165.1 anaerobic dimethyl sulfoxide reductase subunit A [Sanguibacter gelidistatuariae]
METKDVEPAVDGGVSRRSVLKWSAAVGGGAALVGTGVYAGVLPGIGSENAVALSPAAEDKIVWSSCNVNCGSRCPLRMVVKDGQITRVLPDDTGDDAIGTQQIRACVRGRSIRHRIYNPDRLKSPMRRRPGTKRGAGQWDEITWEEAFDEIAATMTRLIRDHGNESIYLNYGTGTLGGTITRSWPPIDTPVARLMNCVGGYLNHYGDYSSAQIAGAAGYHYGGWIGSNSFDDVKNSQLQVMFGNNPLETRMSGGGETFVTQQTKKLYNVRTIVIDPRYSETAQGIGDLWIAPKPGTDAALVAAIAHVMISQNLQDQDFLDTYCQGFDEDHMPDGVPPGNSYRSYIMGLGPDGIEKTPKWASAITGVPTSTLIQLGREIGQARPVHITQGWGPQRHANGENQARAIFTLAAMTGSVGVPGGGTGEREGSFGLPMANPFVSENPVETAISVFSWTDAIEHGPEMTALRDGVRGKDKLDTGIKMVWQYAGNALTNQHGDINRTVALLEDDSLCEMIVVIDNQMTVSARYADILLPDVSNAEQLDVIQQGSAGNMGYAIVADQAIEPLYNCKTIYEMMTEIARRLGVEREFTEGKTQEDWVRQVIDESRAEIPDLPSFEDLREMGVWKVKGESYIGLADFRGDPVANPLGTESGKIEIFSKPLWEISKTWELPEGDRITALPEHLSTWEGAEEARTNDAFPLQVIGHHFKQRTHSTYGNVDWMKEAHPQVVWINPMDAEVRGVVNDDLVEVFNDRGRLRLPARVTPRIAPGVLSVPQGAWFKPDADGVDMGGSVNTLTSWHPSPIAKGNAQHTTLAQLRKA